VMQYNAKERAGLPGVERLQDTQECAGGTLGREHEGPMF